MKSTDVPVKFPIPFADSAVSPNIRQVPTPSQISVQPGAASLTDGYPPVCFLPVGAGGVPPWGADTNGILFQVTSWSQWQNAGGTVKWDATFSGQIGGYPAGSVVASTATIGLYYLCVSDDNLSNPDAAGAGWQAFTIGSNGVVAGNYVRPKISVAADGSVTSAANGDQPTYTVLTAGSGNYNPPAGCKRLYVRMAGGCGGGGGTVGSTVAPTGGGVSTFNGVTANGGPPGGNNNTAGLINGGFQNTNGTGVAIWRRFGSPGGHGGGSSPSSVGIAGGLGGVGPLNRGGNGADSGTTNIGSAGGGASGEYLEMQIVNPVGPIAYVVGGGGNNGDGANVGESGQNGVIFISEFYD